VKLLRIATEAEAAQKGGVRAMIVLRPGNEPIDKEVLRNFDTICSFFELLF
jgi:methionine salvage enolase-phosphatase E1